MSSLLERAKAGDRAALEQLVHTHADWLQKVLRRRFNAALREEIDSRDLVHDVVVELLESGAVATLRDEEHLRALLQKIANGDLVDRRRRRGSRRIDPRELAERAPPPTRPSQRARHAERLQLVQRALAAMGPEDREILHARVWHQQSFAEIATTLGCSEDAARMRCNRALARFADTAERMLGGETIDLGLSR